ncbi:hypothetical protein NMY22_g10078 [Coprinellus aureogranulatus]|nr:hypothetical protein NMY22_g10078 [Coprinellus aureogranulatus]
MHVVGSHCLPSLTDFINTLCQMPLLESLELERSLPCPNATSLDSSFQPFSFPSIRSLTLCDAPILLVHFVKTIHCPIADVTVVCPTHGEPWKETLTAIEHIWKRHGRGNHILKALRATPNGFDLHIELDAPPQSSPYPCSSLTLKVEGFGLRFEGNLSNVFLCNYACHNWKTLTALEVNYNDYMPETYDFALKDTWLFYGELPNIDTLTLVNAGLHFFLRAFTGDPAHNRPPVACFPRLSTIKLSEISGPCDGKDVKLASIISGREKKSYTPLAALHIETSTAFQEPEILFLRASLPGVNVIWDKFGAVVHSVL